MKHRPILLDSSFGDCLLDHINSNAAWYNDSESLWMSVDGKHKLAGFTVHHRMGQTMVLRVKAEVNQLSIYS